MRNQRERNNEIKEKTNEILDNAIKIARSRRIKRKVWWKTWRIRPAKSVFVTYQTVS